MVRCAHRTGGFTLLEMLVALTLMAILATALYMSLHTGFRARRNAEASLEPVRSATLALDFVRRGVESALPPTGILAGAFMGVDETDGGGGSDADVVEFYAPVDDTSGGGRGISKVEFALGEDEDGTGTLLLRKVTSNLLAPEVPDPVIETLCVGVRSFNVRYYDGTVWAESWDSSTTGNTLPVAVEVTLVLDGAGDGEGGYTAKRMLLLPCGQSTQDEAAAGAV